MIPEEERSSEFWEEERLEDHQDMRRLAARWGLVFAMGLSFFAFVLWRSGSAVEYGAARAGGEATAARYRVFGVVRSAITGSPVPWPHVRDDANGRPPLFEATGTHAGTFEMMTLAEPHFIVIAAHGFRATTVKIGKPWYLWMPTGEERVEVTLNPEADTPRQ